MQFYFFSSVYFEKTPRVELVLCWCKKKMRQSKDDSYGTGTANCML